MVDPLNEYVADQMAILGTLGEAVVDAIDVTSMTDVDIAQLEDVYTELSLEVTAAKQVNYGVPVPTEVEDEYEITEIFSLCFVQIDGQWYIDFSTM